MYLFTEDTDNKFNKDGKVSKKSSKEFREAQSKSAKDRAANNNCGFTKQLESKQKAAGGTKEQLLEKAVKEIVQDKTHVLHGKVYPQIEGDYGGRIGTIIIENSLISSSGFIEGGTKPVMSPVDGLAAMCKWCSCEFRQWLLPKVDRKKSYKKFADQVFKVVGGDLPTDRSTASFHAWNTTIVLQRV